MKISLDINFKNLQDTKRIQLELNILELLAMVKSDLINDYIKPPSNNITKFRTFIYLEQIFSKFISYL